MVAAAKPSAAECRARATSRGYILCSPPGWPSRISGAGADADASGVHRMPGISPRVNSRSRTPSSRRCSEVNCMVVPFGSARERRSRTTYRPTVTPEGSTHVDTAFTGTTSSFSRTASGKVAVVAVVRQRVCGGHPQARRPPGAAGPQLAGAGCVEKRYGATPFVRVRGSDLRVPRGPHRSLRRRTPPAPPQAKLDRIGQFPRSAGIAQIGTVIRSAHGSPWALEINSEVVFQSLALCCFQRRS